MRLHLGCEFFELEEVRADDLDRVRAFHAGQAFLDIVLNILREVQVDAGEFGRELALKVLDQILLVAARRPFLEGLQRHEEFRVEKAGGVAAIVGAAMLGHDGDDLGVAFEDLAHPVHDGHAGFERDGRRHGGADPEVAFLKGGQKLGSEPRRQKPLNTRKTRPNDDGEAADAQRQPQHRRIDRADGADHDGFGLLDMLGQEEGGQHGRDGEGRKQRADERVGIGPRHRAEDLPFHALHGEQRHEGGERDYGREQNRGIDLGRADVDQPDPVEEAFVAWRRGRFRRSACGRLRSSSRSLA